jgi:hypothetical protein
MNDRSKTTQVPIQRPTPPGLPGGTAQFQAPPAPPPPPAPRRGRARRLYLLAGMGVVGLLVLGASVYFSIESDGGNSAERPELGGFRGHQAAVTALALSADGRTALSADQAGKVLVWNAEKREAIVELSGHPKPVTALVLSLDGHTAVTGDDQGVVRVWDVKGRIQKHEFAAHGGPVAALVLFPTNKALVTGGRDGRLAVWNLDGPKLLAESALPKGEVTTLAAPLDGSQIVCGDDTGALRILKPATLEELHRFDAHPGGVTGVAVSPRGGQAVSVGKDGKLRRWDLEGLKLLGVLQSPQQETLRAVAYSSGATRALTVSDQGGRLWSLDDEQIVETFAADSGPRRCGLLHPAGTFLIAASTDSVVRAWRTPPPAEIEVTRAREVETALEAHGRKLKRFGEQMSLAKQHVDDKRGKEAVAEFRRAAAGFSEGSLECKLAGDAAAEVDRNVAGYERYADLCEAGKDALEKEEFDKAAGLFTQAGDAIRGLEGEAERTEHREGLKTALRYKRLKLALDDLKVVKGALDFTESAAPRPLEHGRDFAFLLVDEVPPVALAVTPIRWTVDVETQIDFPDEPVDLRIELLEEESGAVVGAVDHPFLPGRRTQNFVGKAAPPASGWKAVSYQLRSTLVVKDKKTEVEKKSFKIGRMTWTEKSFDLSPAQVQQSDYSVKTDVEVRKGEALRVSAEGSIRPAPLGFYREFMGANTLSSPVPAPPEGLPWRFDSLRIDKYRIVDVKANFAALVLRIGYDGSWIPYRAKMSPALAPGDGTLHLSINSIVPRTYSYAGKNLPLTTTDKSYWAPDSGQFHVTIRVGRFDFPEKLTDLQKGGLLLKYFDDEDPSK